ncbi:FecR family protein [Chitinophaga arvensicola]|nr:FecR domain-containing protein [Chitinophaga arvensicola]
MNITSELLAKFFDKRCTPAEAAVVSDYLKSNPDVLNEYLSEAEWEEVRATKVLPASFWDNAWEEIQQRKEQPGGRLIWLKRTAVAASVALLLGAGYMVWINNTTHDKKIVEHKATHHRIENTSETAMQLVLPDSSRVALSPASVLDYEEPFGNSRPVFLTGAAVFTVTKNDKKPFTVYSGVLATTVLGTTFRVEAFQADNTIRVKLLEGKVVVRAADSTTTLKGNYFLSPGEELRYNKQLMTASMIRKIIPVNETYLRERNDAVGNWYMFNKASLATVFDQLSQMYGVPVIYNKTQLNDLYFVGKFEKTDSLKNILQTIGQLNNLKVEPMKNGGYIIK